MSRFTDRSIPTALRRAILDTSYLCGVTYAGNGCRTFAAPGHCHLCHGPGADTLDHLIPRSLGGTSVAGNLRPAHASCNARRAATGAARERPTLVVPW